MLSFLGKYKLYFGIGAAAFAALCVWTYGCIAYGTQKGINKCQSEQHERDIEAWAGTVDELKSWWDEDAADQRKWAEDNRQLSESVSTDINRLAARFERLKGELDYEPIVITDDCRRSYNSIQLRNDARAATAHDHREGETRTGGSSQPDRVVPGNSPDRSDGSDVE